MTKVSERPFELLVFDWDGTLMDSAARIVACMQAAALDAGLSSPPADAVRNIIGLSLRQSFMDLFQTTDEDLTHALIDGYRSHFFRPNSTPSQLFPGVEDTLLQLRSEGYLLAVATGKSRAGLDKDLLQTNLAEKFDLTCCADEAAAKPHPQMLVHIMEQLGVEPNDTMMIGDTEYDLQMARNAGTAAMAVGYGVHESQRLLAHGPMGLLEQIEDLVDWLQERM